MSKRQYRKPGAFRVEDVEVFVPEARVSEARVPVACATIRSPPGS